MTRRHGVVVAEKTLSKAMMPILLNREASPESRGHVAAAMIAEKVYAAYGVTADDLVTL